MDQLLPNERRSRYRHENLLGVPPRKKRKAGSSSRKPRSLGRSQSTIAGCEPRRRTDVRVLGDVAEQHGASNAERTRRPHQATQPANTRTGRDPDGDHRSHAEGDNDRADDEGASAFGGVSQERNEAECSGDMRSDDGGSGDAGEELHRADGDLDAVPHGVDEEGGEEPGNASAPCTTWDWRILWGLIMITGTKRMTKEQYQSVRSLVMSLASSFQQLVADDAINPATSRLLNAAAKLPHYTTLHRAYRSHLYAQLSPRSICIQMPVNLSRRGARADPCQTGNSPTISGLLTLPSEYARADLASPTVFDEMYRMSLSHLEERTTTSSTLLSATTTCVDTIPIVQHRDRFYGRQRSISVDASLDETRLFAAEHGDVIRVALISERIVSPRIATLFAVQSDERLNTQYLQGMITHSWTVRHSSRRDETPAFVPGLNAEENNAVRLASFSDYRSPSDMNTRAEKEAAWRRWTKPAIKPGDFVVLLQPFPQRLRAIPEQERLNRLLLVFRFWCEHSERPRHVLALLQQPSSNGAPVFGSELFSSVVPHSHRDRRRTIPVDVSQITLMGTSQESGDPPMVKPVSSFGRLANGDLYFT